jgi:catechol 2,3-dioxygenase-like lactoylglutathione lyase family enzyme
MTASGINHVSVVARDLEQSVAFYRDVFGLEPIPAPNFGHPVQWLRLGDQQLHLFERPSDAPVYNHLGINVPNFEEVYRKAESLGIFDTDTFGHHIYELPNHDVQMYLRDPSGNLVEVDWPDIRSLDKSVAEEAKRLSERYPQSESNKSASLF